MKNIFSKLILVLPVMLSAVVSFAQEATPVVPEPNFWEGVIGNLTLVVGGIVVLMALFAVVRLFNAMARLEELKLLKEKGIEEIVEAFRQPQPSVWKRLEKYMTKAVPVEQEKDILLDHNYDGIKELDNRLPPWWLWMFYVTIIFSAVYMGYYHIAGGPDLIQEYTISVEKATASIEAYKALQADNINADNVVQQTSPEDLEAGKAVYMANCVACHGNNGEGNIIGPNLTDEYWLHGGSMKNVFTIISDGVIEKGMQPWKSIIRPSDMQLVSSYILSLQGSNPPNPKAPQGDLWIPEAPAADTSAVQDTTKTTAAEPQKTQ